jgi:hypothetical protein
LRARARITFKSRDAGIEVAFDQVHSAPATLSPRFDVWRLGCLKRPSLHRRDQYLLVDGMQFG